MTIWDSFKTESDRDKIVKNIVCELAEAGCELCKIAMPDKDTKNENVVQMKKEMSSTLGMKWVKNNDTWCFIFKKEEDVKSKRGFLSQLMEIFDPLGLIVPFTLKGKLLYRQALNEAKVSWDKILSVNLQDKWRKWHNSLIEIQRIQFKR
jgi:Pao retrotransposon peptidase